MRLYTPLFVLCSLVTLPACMAATGTESSEGSLGFDSPFEPGFGVDFDPAHTEEGPPRFEAGFESPLDSAQGLRLEPDCGCVFPSQAHTVAATCGEAVCVGEQSYFCTYEGVAVTIGACADVSDGALDLTDYEFPNDGAVPSSCQGDAGACDGTTALTCETKAGCAFLPNGECVGSPVPCASRTLSACRELGDECFEVMPR